MILKNYYYYFQSVLSSKFCDEILKFSRNKKYDLAITGEYESKKMNKKDIKNLQKKRSSDIIWLKEPWIYKEIIPFVQEANKKADWNFDFDTSESCQFTKYEVGQHYGWHTDCNEMPYNKPNDVTMHGKIRKLSVTVSLSDPNDYEGGNLEFDFRNQIDWERNKKTKIKEAIEIRPRGSIIVFPSFVWHRVNPVTKGIRYSLVIWNLGYPFK